jgi:hypothetical protein
VDTLKRYIELPYVLHTLASKRLALVSPQAWDDKNDAHHIECYRKRKKLKTLLAACLSEANQTYHHWRVFTTGASGACIEFHRDDFVKWVESNPSLKGNQVIYRTLASVRKKAPLLNELPYLKREAYVDEKEYRVIFEGGSSKATIKEFDFPIALISCVRVNPWVPLTVARSIADMVRRIPGCDGLKLQRSTIVQSDEWQEIGRKAKV